MSCDTSLYDKMVCHPVPCKKFLKESLPELLRDVGEEVLEVEQAAMDYARVDGFMLLTDQEIEVRDRMIAKAREHMAEELTDVITACTTMLAGIGYNRRKRRQMQRFVNEKNKRRGYWEAD